MKKKSETGQNADVFAVLLELYNQAHPLEKSGRRSDDYLNYLSRSGLAVSINLKGSLSTDSHWIG